MLVPALLIVAVGLLALLDVAFELSLLQPQAFWTMAVGLVLTALAGRGVLRTRARNAALTALAVTLVGFTDWTVEKRFVRTLRTITPGMGQDEVRQVMAGYPEGTGWPANPLEPGSTPDRELRVPDHLIFRPTEERGDSSWGLVEFGADGRTVSVRFIPD